MLTIWEFARSHEYLGYCKVNGEMLIYKTGKDIISKNSPSFFCSFLLREKGAFRVTSHYDLSQRMSVLTTTGFKPLKEAYDAYLRLQVSE